MLQIYHRFLLISPVSAGKYLFLKHKCFHLNAFTLPHEWNVAFIKEMSFYYLFLNIAAAGAAIVVVAAAVVVSIIIITILLLSFNPWEIFTAANTDGL